VGLRNAVTLRRCCLNRSDGGGNVGSVGRLWVVSFVDSAAASASISVTVDLGGRFDGSIDGQHRWRYAFLRNNVMCCSEIATLRHGFFGRWS